jgi:hypothetical protein
LGEKNFLLGIQCLCIDKKAIVTEDKLILDNINNFQIFMKLMNDPEFTNRKNIVFNTIELILPDYTYSFIANRSIVFTNKKT